MRSMWLVVCSNWIYLKISQSHDNDDDDEMDFGRGDLKEV